MRRQADKKKTICLSLEGLWEAVMLLLMYVMSDYALLHSSSKIRLYSCLCLTVLFVLHFVNEIFIYNYTRHFVWHWLHVAYFYGCIIIVTILCIVRESFMTEYGSAVVAVISLLDFTFLGYKDELIKHHL